MHQAKWHGLTGVLSVLTTLLIVHGIYGGPTGAAVAVMDTSSPTVTPRPNLPTPTSSPSSVSTERSMSDFPDFVQLHLKEETDGSVCSNSWWAVRDEGVPFCSEDTQAQVKNLWWEVEVLRAEAQDARINLCQPYVNSSDECLEALFSEVLEELDEIHRLRDDVRHLCESIRSTQSSIGILSYNLVSCWRY
jgi:hypothetical protein